MILPLRLFVLWLACLVVGTTAAQAQTIYIRSLSPTSVCAGSPFSFVADVFSTAPNGSVLTDLYLYNNTYADSVKLEYTSVYSPSLGRYAFTVATTIPRDRLTSAYYLRFGLIYNGQYIYSSPKSDLLRVNAIPPSPGVGAISICQNTTAPLITSAVTASGQLKWYSSLTSTSPIATPVISTNTAGSLSYYVSQSDGNGCESDRATVNVTVNPTPTPPSVTPLSVCQNTTPPLITSAITASSGNLKWYSSPTSTSPIATPVLSSAVVGIITYYVSQTSQYGCESNRAAISYTVNALPAAPVLNPNVLFYCQGVPAPSLPTSLNGNALSWYATQTGGNRLTNLIPQTTVAGTTIYYASQTNANQCESTRSSLTVRISSRPAPPQVSTPAPYCPDVTAAPLSAIPLTGNSLRWYGTDASGGVGSSNPTIPSTQNSGQSPILTSYYISQVDGNGCESDRAGITVTINPRPVAPTVIPLSVCLNTPAPLITSAITASSGALKWYSPTSMSLAAAPVLSSAVVGSTTYFVTQNNAFGCESTPASISYTVNALPSAPTLNPNSAFYCQGTVAPGLPTSLNGNALSWYTAQVGGDRLTNLVPQTVDARITTYFASQTDGNGCEGSRSAFTVQVSSRPTPPLVSQPPAYCQNGTAAPLSATALAGNTLGWYTTPTGGDRMVTLTPLTTNAGTTTYYVSQVDGNGCESDRASVSVVVNAAPVVSLTNNGPLSTSKPSVLLTASGGTAYTFSTGAIQIAGGNTATVTTPGLYSVTATATNGCSAVGTTTVSPSFDLTAVLYARPSTVYNTSTFSVVVDILELLSVPTSGPIVVKISKDALTSLSFSPATTLLNNHPVQNSQWSFDASSDEGYYLLSTNSVIEGGRSAFVWVGRYAVTGFHLGHNHREFGTGKQ